jgi:phosphoribosylformylglycinamidine synthase
MNTIQLVLKDNIKDVVGIKLKDKIKRYLNINTGNIKTIKVFSLDLPVTNEELKKFADYGLKDSVLHEVFINKNYYNPAFKSFILVSKLYGVTDDEGISAQNLLNDILNKNYETHTQKIFTHNLYLFENQIAESKLKKIAEDFLGNKLINKFKYGTFTKNISFSIFKLQSQSDIHTKQININISDEELIRLSESMLLSLNLEEMKAIRNYYLNPNIIKKRKEKNLSENPTDCELEVFAQTWSEHCKHKEFAAIIDYENAETNEKIRIDSLFNTYIKASTLKIKENLKKYDNDWLLKVFSDNAGVVKINDNSVFVWKVETHNSPSALDPYGGAITGILGNNRDPMGTGIGGAKLLFNTDVLCFGPPNYDKPLIGNQLHPKRILEGVTAGIEDGGNKSGIPTVNGSVIFDERYAGKPLVFCGTGGIMKYKVNGRKSWEKIIDSGDLIFMAGGRVGKDGIHGATFSSAEINESSPLSAVQIGSPITQKLLYDFLLKAVNEDLIKCSTDNGAGGLSSSIGELAEISGGAMVFLEKVPLKYPDLKPWEIFISESQERMTLVVEQKNKSRLIKLAKEMDVEISEIGLFTDSGYLDVRYNNDVVAYLDMDFLHNGVPKKYMIAKWEKPKLSEASIPDNIDYNKILLQLSQSLNICSRESIIRQYDHEVKGKSIIKPLMGQKGQAPQDAAVMRLDFNGYEAVAISNGIMPKFGDLDPYQMSAGAFDEAIRQIIAVGGRLPNPKRKDSIFWSVNDNFCVPDSFYDEKNNPDGKLKLAKLVQMNMALYDMATFFNIPMTSGKDSMKNDFKADNIKISIPPTILYSMVAKINDFRKTITSHFKAEGDLIYQVGKTYNELGGSEFLKLFNQLGKNVPVVRKKDAKRIYEKMADANDLQIIQSAHDISDGGMLMAIAESLFSKANGADLNLDNFIDLSCEAILFAESHSRFIVSIAPKDKEKFEQIMKNDAIYLGKVTNSGKLIIKKGNKTIIDLETDKILEKWNNGLAQALNQN